MTKIIKGKRAIINGGGSSLPNGKIYDLDYLTSGANANNLSEYQTNFSGLNPSVNGNFNLTSDGYLFGQNQSSYLRFSSHPLILDLLRVTVFFKIKTAASIINADLFNSVNIFERPRIALSSDGTIFAYYFDGSRSNTVFTPPGTVIANTEAIIAARFNSSNVSLWMGNNFWTRDDFALSNTNNPSFQINIFPFLTLNNYFNGFLKRFILFNRPLSDAEVAQVRGII